MELVEKFLAGNQQALARVITLIEDGAPEAMDIMRQLYPRTGNAHVIGITGAPGVGKSTLVDQLAAHYREMDKKVGIIAVDPTSPFTGGAILGDRVRMQKGNSDAEVFIRSVATRGHLGGVTEVTKEVVKAMEAFGKDVIFIETVGAGQSEVEVGELAHTIIVVLAPGLGDEIQFIKAGILEIGDIFVVNKADVLDTEKTVYELALGQGLERASGWSVPIVKTIARNGSGIPEAVSNLMAHYSFLNSSGLLQKKKSEESSALIKKALVAEVTRCIWNEPAIQEDLQALLSKVEVRDTDPYTAAERILKLYSKLLLNIGDTKNQTQRGGNLG